MPQVSLFSLYVQSSPVEQLSHPTDNHFLHNMHFNHGKELSPMFHLRAPSSPCFSCFCRSQMVIFAWLLGRIVMNGECIPHLSVVVVLRWRLRLGKKREGGQHSTTKRYTGIPPTQYHAFAVWNYSMFCE